MKKVFALAAVTAAIVGCQSNQNDQTQLSSTGGYRMAITADTTAYGCYVDGKRKVVNDVTECDNIGNTDFRVTRCDETNNAGGLTSLFFENDSWCERVAEYATQVTCDDGSNAAMNRLCDVELPMVECSLSETVVETNSPYMCTEAADAHVNQVKFHLYSRGIVENRLYLTQEDNSSSGSGAIPAVIVDAQATREAHDYLMTLTDSVCGGEGLGYEAAMLRVGAKTISAAYAVRDISNPLPPGSSYPIVGVSFEADYDTSTGGAPVVYQLAYITLSKAGQKCTTTINQPFGTTPSSEGLFAAETPDTAATDYIELGNAICAAGERPVDFLSALGGTEYAFARTTRTGSFVGQTYGVTVGIYNTPRDNGAPAQLIDEDAIFRILPSGQCKMQSELIIVNPSPGAPEQYTEGPTDDSLKFLDKGLEICKGSHLVAIANALGVSNVELGNPGFVKNSSNTTVPVGLWAEVYEVSSNPNVGAPAVLKGWVVLPITKVGSEICTPQYVNSLAAE